mmetsp:Transcript_29420/g.77803  ORF Transcript_29420/g.77803 Transcript_29420/m.77803 type:complete len:346 (-) Transcript_29420:28-1065(-)
MELPAAVHAFQAMDTPFELWPFWVHVGSDVVDLVSLVLWFADCSLLDDTWLPKGEFHEDVMAVEATIYILVLGLMLPIVGVALHLRGLAPPGSSLRKFYLYSEVLFDCAEFYLVAYLKEKHGHQTQEKHGLILLLTVLTTCMDLVVLKGPDAFEEMSPGFGASLTAAAAQHTLLPREGPGEGNPDVENLVQTPLPAGNFSLKSKNGCTYVLCCLLFLVGLGAISVPYGGLMQEACKVHSCGEDYLLKEGAEKLTGSDDQTCCEQACSAHSCGEDYLLKQGAEKLAGGDDQTCCELDERKAKKAQGGVIDTSVHNDNTITNSGRMSGNQVANGAHGVVFGQLQMND